MSELAYSGEKTIHVRLRPVRIAVLIDETDSSWRGTCLSIIELASQIWGGRYSLIIPTDGQRIREDFWVLLQAFDPDYLYPYEESLRERMQTSSPLVHELGTRLNPFRFLQGPAGEVLQHAIRYFDTPPLVSADLLYVLPGAPRMPIMDIGLALGNKDLKLYVYSQSGKLDTFKRNLEKAREVSHRSGILARRVPLDQLDQIASSIYRHTFHKKDLYSILHLIWRKRPFVWPPGEAGLDEKSYEHLPFSISMTNTDPLFRAAETARIAHQRPVLVVGDSAADFCLYYDLSRMRSDVYWISKMMVKRASETSEAHQAVKSIYRYFMGYLKTQLGDRLPRGTSSDRKVLVTSVSESRKKLKDIITLFGRPTGVVGDELRDGLIQVCSDVDKLLPAITRFYEKGNWENSYLHEFRGGRDTVFLSTPIPRSFSPISPDHHWVTEVEIEGYQLPSRRELAQCVVDHSTIPSSSGQQVRVSNDGICYWCPRMGLIRAGYEISPMTVLRPRLRIPSDLEIMQEVFGAARYYAQYSAWGDYIRESIAKFGSLDETDKFLLDGRFQPVFRKSVDSTKNKPGVFDEGVFLNERLPRLLDWRSIQKIIQDPDTCAQFIDELGGKGILERGYLFRCEYCRNSEWYPMTRVDETFFCVRCGKSQRWSKKHWKEPIEEPHLYYKMDQIVFQALRQEMIPVIHCLQKLRKDSSSFLVVPGIELRRNLNQEQPDLEIDICAVIDGRLVLGEVTVKATLDHARSPQSRRICRWAELSARIRPAKFVFATSKERWNCSTKTLIRDNFRKVPISIELWCKRDLVEG